LSFTSLDIIEARSAQKKRLNELLRHLIICAGLATDFGDFPKANFLLCQTLGGGIAIGDFANDMFRSAAACSIFKHGQRLNGESGAFATVTDLISARPE
jgi:hypothetical protein